MYLKFEVYRGIDRWYCTRGCQDKLELPMGNETSQWTGIPIRALHFVFGWQMDRITVELPHVLSVGVFGVGLVWLAVLSLKGGGADWGLAFAFAQVVAASIAILMTSLRY